MPSIPDSELRALLDRTARELLRVSDEGSADRMMGRALLALVVARWGSHVRVDILRAFDKVAAEHLQTGVFDKVQILAGGKLRTIQRKVSVGPVETRRFEARMKRIVLRFQRRPFGPEQANKLAGYLAVEIEERWPSLPYHRTFNRLRGSLRRHGIAEDVETVVRRTLRAGGVTPKHHRNFFNAASVATWREGKVKK